MESILHYPKITLTKENKYYITVYANGKRWRLYNGSSLGINIYPNSFSEPDRFNAANLLASEIFKVLQKGNTPSKIISKKLTDVESLKAGLNHKLAQPFSSHHKTMLKYAYKALVKRTNGYDINIHEVQETLNHFKNGTSYNMMRRYLSSLISSAKQFGLELDITSIRKKKTDAKLHKPIMELEYLVKEIKQFNDNLHLCCLLTYGYLLRPHREVRELKWGDFTEDLSYIRLSGSRNKSGRNRIVPVPYYIKEVLKKETTTSTFSLARKNPLLHTILKGFGAVLRSALSC